MEMAKKRIIYTFIVTAIVVFSTTYAILMTLERNDYRNYLQGQYSKNMYELISSVQNIRVDLSKSAVVGSKEQSIVIFGDIFRYASIANDSLHSLPISQEIVQNTSKFLSQVGDFSSSLARLNSEGKKLTEENYKKIEMLKQGSMNLESQLNEVLNNVNKGNVRWGEIRKEVSGVLAKNSENDITKQFMDIQKQVVQYPTLIYDGPFSDNVLEIKPRISKLPVVTKDQAEQVIKKAIGEDRIANIQYMEYNSSGRIESYSFQVTIKDRPKNQEKVACEVSKNGGKLLYLLDNRDVTKAVLKTKEAADIGTKYLESLGYTGLVPTYNLNYNNTAVISYVYRTKNINIYPSQIKLKVALDNGGIVGVESEKYLIAYNPNRKISKPKISISKAMEKVSKNLEIKSKKLAIIPTETNKEVLCYEFVGTYKEDTFIVYINADTGYEQRIVQIINTPNGELTM